MQQEGAPKESGYEKISCDKVSGVKSERPGFQNALSFLHDGEDVLVVWRLDRLGRSFKDLIELVNHLEERKIGFRNPQDPVDNTSPGGKLGFRIFRALAEIRTQCHPRADKNRLVCRQSEG